ncbi:MAG: hypothetical protein HP497_04050 [Nitrospira sp.]|nr:hypothetical protein [Nitrospira sp.]
MVADPLLTILLAKDNMASFTYNDFRVELKWAGFEKLRCLAGIKMLGCKT